MTGKLYAGPGFARRSDHFHDDLEALERQSPGPELNRLKVDKALHLGTAEELAPQERCLMAALLAHLDIGSTASGNTSVWPGAKRLCTLLQIGESTLRRLKGNLEEKGFIIRRYDRRNRPLKDGAIDLKPFLVKVEDLCTRIDRINSHLAAERGEKSCDRDVSTSITRPPNPERLTKNSQQDTFEHEGVNEREAGGGEKDISTQDAQTLWDLAGEGKLDLSSPQSRQQLAQTVLGQSRGPRLLQWAEKRHGQSATLALVLAAVDPTIESPVAWFGWYSSTTSSVDLAGRASKLRRVLDHSTLLPVPDSGACTPFLSLFSEAVGREKCSSYLSGAEFDSIDGTLRIRVRTRTARQRLSTDLSSALQLASQRAGFDACTVECVV